MNILIRPELRGDAVGREVYEEAILRPEPKRGSDIGYSASWILCVKRQ
jgi:hypothetical protein